MKKILLGAGLILFANIALACSSKDQLNVLFISEKGGSVSHKDYTALGKALFENQNIAKELHAYNVTVNHQIGEIVLDIESQKTPVEKVLKEIKPLLKAHGFTVMRASIERPIGHGDAQHEMSKKSAAQSK